MMFIVQGLFPILFAAIWWWAVEDRPSEAKWLKDHNSFPSRKDDLRARGSAPPGLAFFGDPNVLIFMALNLAFSCGAYGLLIWLPSAIRSFGARNNLVIGILTAMPYVFSGVGAVWNSRLSDRAGERRWHVAVPCFAGGISLALGFKMSGIVPFLGLLFLCATGAAIYASIGPKWAMMTEILPNVTPESH
jgi:predicted MFS family arabinose efflux permease